MLKRLFLVTLFILGLGLGEVYATGDRVADKAIKKLDELAATPTSGDWLVVSDVSADQEKKIDVDRLALTGAANAFTGDNVFTGANTHSGDETGIVICKSVNFVEVAGGITELLATIPIPAGTYLLDVQFMVSVLAGGTSASLTIGDDDDADGWLTATDLKATDILVGEVFSILNSGATDTDSAAWVQATQGAYLTNVGRKGSVASGNAGVYYGSANNVIATIAQGTPSTTGRYHMVVYYTIPTIIASVDS